ncbi:hypothetical protein CRYUN_Cryun35bG0022300 [Craigia yunnanensis]
MQVALGCQILLLVTMFSRWSNSHDNQENDSLQHESKIVKYFMDAKTFQKVKFVYPKNEDSVELMRSYFEEENLPTEFGGKAILECNHEESPNK